MGDEAKPQAGEAETIIPQPQAGAHTTPEPQAGDGQSIEQISLEEAKKLRSEAFNLRKRLRELDASHAELKTFKEQIEAERLTAEEKQQLANLQREQQLTQLQQERDTARQQMQSLYIVNEVMRHGTRLNILDLDAAAKLLDLSQIEYDDGTPTNVEVLLKAMVKERPWLAGRGATPTSGGATNPSRSQSSAPEALSWQKIAEMASTRPEEYRARRAEIQQWMSNNPMPR